MYKRILNVQIFSFISPEALSHPAVGSQNPCGGTKAPPYNQRFKHNR